MELEIVKNINDYFLFLEEEKEANRQVVRANIQRFISMSFGIIHFGIEKRRGALGATSFFNPSLNMEKVNFKRFLEQAEVIGFLGKLRFSLGNLKLASANFKNQIQDIIKNGEDLDQRYLPNYIDNILRDMFSMKFKPKGFESKHRHVASRLTEEAKTTLFSIYHEFHNLVKNEVNSWE